MDTNNAYFFCGIGGSGMLPLALIMKAKGCRVAGSDRALDQGRTPQKFDFIRNRGIALFPQDGSGIAGSDQTVVISAAVEETVADLQAARRNAARVIVRAELLAALFNSSRHNIGVAGTSGKSTVTGMIGWILYQAGRKPTIMNGAVMKNFVTADVPFASAVVGNGDVFVSEVDESDGSIACFTPRIAVVNNVALDHKTLDELRALFAEFVARAEITIVNADNVETARLAAAMPRERVVSYGMTCTDTDLRAFDLTPSAEGIAFDVRERGSSLSVRTRLRIPGRHNVANALAALGAVRAYGVGLEEAANALDKFSGIRRRLEIVGCTNGITVIDDFAHNPDKIAATLSTLHGFPGRLLVMFQPHGFGPLKLMKAALIDCLVHELGEDDVLLMPEPLYFGGTTDRSVASGDIVTGVRARGRTARAFAGRGQCGDAILALARPGDRVVVMGARDDTLSTFAADLLAALRG